MWFMDSLKKFWDKTKEKFNEAVNFSAEKISTSSAFSILTKKDLSELIEKTETTEFQSKETWEIKYFKHKWYLVIADEKADSFKKISLLFPILKTKAFSANSKIMLAKSNVEDLNLMQEYELSELPAIIVFENKEVYKIIIWEENIEKISKSFKMNIEEIIEEF